MHYTRDMELCPRSEGSSARPGDIDPTTLPKSESRQVQLRYRSKLEFCRVHTASSLQLVYC